MTSKYEIILKKTCGACPEQYDAYHNGSQVGYLRLRNGFFRVDFGFCGGDTIYETDEVQGDGCFEDGERAHYLEEAINAIFNEMQVRGYV